MKLLAIISLLFLSPTTEQSIDTKDGGKLKFYNEGCLSNNGENCDIIIEAIIENLDIKSDFCQHEIFGPVVSIHKVKSNQEALVLANSTNFGLTSAVHTTNINTALWFTRNIVAGVVNVNLPTFGSEPHMPFGGFKLSGNGTREPGSEAIDFYSELKNISLYSYS